MIASLSGTVFFYVILGIWVVILWAVCTNRLRLGWSDIRTQYTFLYCPNCSNELAGDEHTVCVDQARWRQDGEDPDDLVEEWHLRMTHGPGLAEYMGLSEAEYSLWVEYPPVNEYEVVYKCGKCKTYSAWDFDHYPAPIHLRHRVFKDYTNISNGVTSDSDE